MGALRVTQGLIVQRTLNNLSAQTRRLLRLQEQFASSLRVNRPSDDPVATQRAVDLRATIQQNERFIANISDARPFLLETETTLRQAVDILQRIRELTLQGANGTNAQPQRDQLALEIDQLLEEFVKTANHQTSGRFLYGGTRTLSEPFSVTRNAQGEIDSVTYDGNNEFIEVAISTEAQVATNIPGPTAFQGNTDIFATLIGIREDLQAGAPANLANLSDVRLAQLDSALDQLLVAVARVGAIENRLERVSTATDDFNFQLRVTLSDKIDADFAETIVQFNAQSNAFQAALNAAARVIQPSLLDFIR